MRALHKSDLINMINALYINEDDLIFTDNLVNQMRTFGDEYQYSKEEMDVVLVKENDFRF